MLRCCKRPADSDGPIYDAVTKPGSREPVAPYLRAEDAAPQRLSSGQPGTRAGPDPARAAISSWRPETSWRKPTRQPQSLSRHYRRADPRRLRNALLRSFPWLGEPAPARISCAERRWTFCASLLFAVPRPFLSFDSRHGGGADHPGLAVRHPDSRSLAGLVGDPPVAACSALRRRGRADPVRRAHAGEPVRQEQADVAGHPVGLLFWVALLCRRCHRDRVVVAIPITGSSYPRPLWPTVRVVVLGLAASPSRFRRSCCGCAGSNGAIPPRTRRRSIARSCAR